MSDLNAAGAPSIVRASWCPDSDVCMTLGAYMVLESLKHPIISGGKLTIEDALIAYMAMQDPAKVRSAIAGGTLNDMAFDVACRIQMPDLVKLTAKVKAARDRGFDPLDSGSEDPGKNESRASAGG